MSLSLSARLAHWLDVVHQDVAFAVRGFRRSPALTTVVVATLALGIGANGALFSLADPLFLRQPDGIAVSATLRRIYLRSNWPVGGVTVIRGQFSYPAFAALRSALASRGRTVAYTPSDSMGLGDGDALIGFDLWNDSRLTLQSSDAR